MSNTVDKIISIALAEEGYLEKASNKNLDSKTSNVGSNNWTKYGRDLVLWIGSPYANGVAWCDEFVDWCFIKAYGISEAKKLINGWSAYTPTSAQYYKNIGRYYKSLPKVGDQIFFKNANSICHTGLVYKVDSSYVYTIEGNTSSTSGVVANGGGVFKKKYSLSYSKIDGYGRPKYDSEYTKGWIQDSVGWWYQYSDGSYPKSCWKTINGKEYYFKADGYMAVNEYIKASDYETTKKIYWVNEKGEWNNKSYRWMFNNKGYWIAEIGGSWYPVNEWAKVDGKWYYFDASGYMVTGVVVIDGVTYNFRADGSLVE